MVLFNIKVDTGKQKHTQAGMGNRNITVVNYMYVLLPAIVGLIVMSPSNPFILCLAVSSHVTVVDGP